MEVKDFFSLNRALRTSTRLCRPGNSTRTYIIRMSPPGAKRNYRELEVTFTD